MSGFPLVGAPAAPYTARRTHAAMSTSRALLLAIVLLLCAAPPTLASHTKGGQAPADWRTTWAVPEGFSLAVDTTGFTFPTAIVFVPNPGPGPKDPLYFVAEYHNRVSVVTNDRTVTTFVEGFYDPLRRTMDESTLDQALANRVVRNFSNDRYFDEGGVTGLCLDPERGFVFVTFGYGDANKVLRSGLMRFESVPRTFSTTPHGRVDLSVVFARDTTRFSHHVSTCQVVDRTLFVGVGDGMEAAYSADLDSTRGKILRMTLDGRPLPDNPFRVDDDVRRPRNFVWAYGLRNPFSLKVVDGSLYVADNGLEVDRFVKIERGANYLWSGTDWSMGSRADLALHPSIGPTQLDFRRPGAGGAFPAAYDRTFFVGSASIPSGVVIVPFGIDVAHMVGVPRPFIQSLGARAQRVVGVAFGPDGLYFSAIDPAADGSRTPILKVAYDPAHRHALTLDAPADGLTLMRAKGCFSCHRLNQTGGDLGPPLDREAMIVRIQKRLDSAEYRRASAQLDALAEKPWAAYRTERHKILESKGLERLRLWMQFHLTEPAFDTASARMPNPGLTPQETSVLAEFLLGATQTMSVRETLAYLLVQLLFPLIGSPVRYQHVVGAFVLGGVLVGGVWGTTRVVRRMVRRRGITKS